VVCCATASALPIEPSSRCMVNASQIENLIKLIDERDHTAAITHHEQPIIGAPPQRRLR
jgi:hypothetical protein